MVDMEPDRGALKEEGFFDSGHDIQGVTMAVLCSGVKTIRRRIHFTKLLGRES